MNSVFDKYSEYYDLLYKEKDYQLEANYVSSFFSKNNNNLLDLGCGTGSHAYYFSKMGYKISGIDFSKKQIDIAKNKNIKNTVFEIGDLRNFKLKKFGNAYSLFHVVSYLSTDDDVIKSFKNINNHLIKGGVFVFDCWNKPAVLNDPPGPREKKIKNQNLKITRKTTVENVFSESTSKIFFEIEVHDLLNNITHQFNEEHIMRFFSKIEIELFAYEAGFSSVKSFNWLESKKSKNESYYKTYILTV